MSAPPVIAYAGMTHLGLCSAIAAASKGFVTLGFDPDADLVARLDAGRLPVVETGSRSISCMTTARAFDLRTILHDCANAISSMSPPTCQPTIAARAISPDWTGCLSSSSPILGRMRWSWC